MFTPSRWINFNKYTFSLPFMPHATAICSLHLCFSWSFSCPFMTQLEWCLEYSSSPSFVFIFSFILKGSGTSSPLFTVSLSLILSAHFLSSLVSCQPLSPKPHVCFYDLRKWFEINTSPFRPIHPRKTRNIGNRKLITHNPRPISVADPCVATSCRSFGACCGLVRWFLLYESIF